MERLRSIKRSPCKICGVTLGSMLLQERNNKGEELQGNINLDSFLTLMYSKKLLSCNNLNRNAVSSEFIVLYTSGAMDVFCVNY